jgi:hypothetical protein
MRSPLDHTCPRTHVIALADLGDGLRLRLGIAIVRLVQSEHTRAGGPVHSTADPEYRHCPPT